MKIQKINGGGYFSPEVERVDVQIEKGFAASESYNDSLGGGLGEDGSVDLE